MKLLVGDVNGPVTAQAFFNSPDALLMNDRNYLESPEIGYTGIKCWRDKTKYFALLRRATEIEYFPPVDRQYSTSEPRKTSVGFEEYLLTTVHQENHSVINAFSTLQWPDITSKRRAILETEPALTDPDLPPLYFAGCSITVGVGVEPEQSFPYLVAAKLGYSPGLIARGGVGNEWVADQIIRHYKLTAGDTVVWTLTSNERYEVFEHKVGLHLINVNTWQSDPVRQELLAPKLLFDHPDHWAANTVKAVARVQHFCRVADINLHIIGGILSNEEMLFYFRNTHGYHHFTNPELNYSIDRGTDGSHPGPLQHQRYADFVYSVVDHLQK